MTNKITPFAVDTTNHSEEEIRWLHAKCLEAGAIDCNTVEDFLDEKVSYPFKGIDYAGETLSHSEDYLGEWFNNNIIPLDQVEYHLGLTPPSEADTSSVSDSPVKWTIAMQKAGKPLEVGMWVLIDGDEEVKVGFIGEEKCFVTNGIGIECAVTKGRLKPFPDEETPEQVKQREEFEEVMRNNGIEELTTNIDEVYEELKHLFKY